MLFFSNYAKNYASTIRQGLLLLPPPLRGENDSKSGYRKRSFKFLWRKWTQLHPNTFRDCRVQFSDNLSRTSCTTSPSPFKRLPRRHRRVIGFYDVLETFNLRACALQWTIVILAVWRENVVHGFQHRQPKLCGSSLDFAFIIEYMKTKKIRPKFQFWTKIEIEMTYLVFVFCYLLSLRL